jgi:hypothetical protein
MINRCPPFPVIRYCFVLLLFILCAEASLAEGGGVALIRSRENESEEVWQAMPYASAKPFAVVVKILPVGGKDTVSIPLAQVAALIELPDLKTGVFLQPSDAKEFTAARAKLDQWAKRCRKAAPTLTAMSKQLQQAEEKLATGSVLRIGKWTSAEDWKKEQAANNQDSKLIPILTVGGKSYKKAGLSAIQGGEITLRHEGGICLLPISALSDAQISQLNATTSKLQIVRIPGSTDQAK